MVKIELNEIEKITFVLKMHVDKHSFVSYLCYYYKLTTIVVLFDIEISIIDFKTSAYFYKTSNFKNKHVDNIFFSRTSFKGSILLNSKTINTWNGLII